MRLTGAQDALARPGSTSGAMKHSESLLQLYVISFVSAERFAAAVFRA